MYDGSKWYFHDNQYDRVHPEGASATSYPMDLFCWGNVPNPAYNGEAFVGGMNYLNVGSGSGTDWGSNDIVNGGGPLPYWRTPWQEDLDYMLKTRTDAANKYALGRVADVNGLIILPDDYAGTALKTSHTGWINNIIDASSWVIYEAYGAVFLPTAGYRYGGNIINLVGSDGQYWTATPTKVETIVGSYDGSYYLSIDNDGILWMKTDDRDEGRSVRLISDAS